MKRRRYHPPDPEALQFYQPRVEVVIHAQAHALEGCRLLSTYLLEQQGPNAAEAGHFLTNAALDFQKALQWMRKEHRLRVICSRKRGV